MYADSQEPLNLHPLACMVLLLAALALAGCSTSPSLRPPLHPGPTPQTASAPSHYTIKFKGTPSRLGFEEVKSKSVEYLKRSCHNSLKSKESTEKHRLQYTYTLCGSLTATMLEQGLKEELGDFNPPPQVRLADKIFTISVQETLPIFSPVEVTLQGKPLEECTENMEDLRQFKGDYWNYEKDDVPGSKKCFVESPKKVFNNGPKYMFDGRCYEYWCETSSGYSPSSLGDSCPNGGIFIEAPAPRALFHSFEFDPPTTYGDITYGDIDFCWSPTERDSSDCSKVFKKCFERNLFDW